MVHDSRESNFTNFDWGQGTRNACDLQSLVPSPKSQVRNCKDGLNHAEGTNLWYVLRWFYPISQLKRPL